MVQANDITPGSGDALVIVDVQNDFLPGGSLAVAEGDQVLPALNRCIDIFSARELPIFATRDWHPLNHCSFQAQGGPWPPHCVEGTRGAAFATELNLPCEASIVSKAISAGQDAYSGFEGTELDRLLRQRNITRLFVGGLATDYCVLNTVRDALQLGYCVCLLMDAIRAVNVEPGDGARAVAAMTKLGAQPATSTDLV